MGFQSSEFANVIISNHPNKEKTWWQSAPLMHHYIKWGIWQVKVGHFLANYK